MEGTDLYEYAEKGDGYDGIYYALFFGVVLLVAISGFLGMAFWRFVSQPSGKLIKRKLNKLN